MRVLIPFTTKDNNLLSSNITEDDYGTWSSSTSYSVDDKVISTTTHRIYEALQASTNVDPTTDTADPPYWLDLGATNRWRAFDKLISDPVTVASGTNTVEYTLGGYGVPANAVVLFGIKGREVELTVTDASLDETTYTVTVASGTRSDSTTGDVFFFGLNERPTITFRRGNTYIFDQSDSSNVGHQILIQDTSGFAYTDGVTTTGTLGTDSLTTFVVPDDAPDGLEYYCENHGIVMGNSLVVEGDGQVYNNSISLIDNGLINDWFTYFFEPSRVKSEAIFESIPPYANGSFEVVVTDNTIAEPELGQIVVGQEYQLGVTSYGTSVSIEDFSRKERDVFGNAILVERPFAKLIDFDFSINTGEARRTALLLEQVRATPAVYLAGPDTERYGTTVYGFFRNFSINLGGPALSNVTLEVEGLT